MQYRMVNGQFSRMWRRSKDYSEVEIKWRARRAGLSVNPRRGGWQVVDRRKNIIATFAEIPDTEPRNEKTNERLQAFAALKGHVRLA